MAAECDVLVSGLPKPPDVRRVFEGADGILAGAREGTVWIDHSTSDFGQGGGGNKLSSIHPCGKPALKLIARYYWWSKFQYLVS